MRAGSVGGWKPTQRLAAGEQHWHYHVVSTQKPGSKGVTAHFHLLSHTWQETAAGGNASEMHSLSHFLSLIFSLSVLYLLLLHNLMHVHIILLYTFLQNRSQPRERAGLHFIKVYMLQSCHALESALDTLFSHRMRPLATSPRHILFFYYYREWENLSHCSAGLKGLDLLSCFDADWERKDRRYHLCQKTFYWSSSHCLANIILYQNITYDRISAFGLPVV